MTDPPGEKRRNRTRQKKPPLHTFIAEQLDRQTEIKESRIRVYLSRDTVDYIEITIDGEGVLIRNGEGYMVVQPCASNMIQIKRNK